MRSKILGTVVALVFILLIVYAFSALLKFPKHRINEESFNKIAVGMSEDDVVAILGVPYGQHYSGKKVVTVPFGPTNTTGSLLSEELEELILRDTCRDQDGNFCWERKGWVGEDLSIWILFDEHRKVMSKFTYPVTPINP